MSVRFKNFLGRDLVIPDDRSYDPVEGLWIKQQDDGSLAVGFTEPSVLMAGTIREIELLVEDGSTVSAGETVLLALTSKLKYIATPISGKMVGAEDFASLPAKIVEEPYGAILFHIVAQEGDSGRLLDAAGYVATLKDSDGARNPGGHKGGVSPTCKAVYMGIAHQNIKK